MMTVENILSCLKDYQQSAKTIRSKYPFYDWACKNVPGYKTKEGNVAFRKRCLKLAENNEQYARQLWIMCSRDLLFFVNTFVMTYNPRLVPKSTVVPFITYDFQDVALDQIKDSIEIGYDELTEKSRDMGASWMYLIVYTWYWDFKPWMSFRLLSRTEDLVDKADDPDSLFWKIMFLLDHCPKFLVPAYKKNHLALTNLDNKSTIIGVTTTSDAARGGRCAAMLIDEFAAVPDGDGILSATRDVTKVRHFNSTHKGAGTAFYRLSKGKIRKLVTHWSVHDTKSKGLYRNINGKPVLLDDFKGVVVVNGEQYNYPDEYPFRLDEKLRSPWYDNECDRAVHPMEIAQELDMDPFASDFQYFDGIMIEEIKNNDVKKPYLEGILEFDQDSLESIEFVAGENGPLKLWIYPDTYGCFPLDLTIGCGADISAGTGASNSTMSFVNLQTGEKIAEYADPWIKPESFAHLAVALCKYFNNAFMVFDGAGPGRTFGDEVISTGYRNLYFRRNEEGLNKKVSDKPGVFLNPKEKTATLGAYRRSLKDKTFIQRSEVANQECLAYIFTTGNSIEHSASVNSIDPSGAKDNHGDRVIADALAAKCLDLIGNKKMKTPNQEPQNCYAARKREYEKSLVRESEW